MTHNTIGMQAAATLLQAVRLRWFDAAPRVEHWQRTIADAYDAHVEGEPDRSILFPGGAWCDSGDNFDAAANVLDAFDNWLGHDVVWDALAAVQGGLDDLDDTITDDTGVQLAIRLGW